MTTTTRQTVCLSMIVRNEEKVLPRCLRSVAPLIDAWAIVDTGSTDGTERVIREHLGHLPGELVRRPHPERTWLDRVLNRGHFDFAANRNVALDAARRSGCDYALVIDADEEIRILDGFPAVWPELTADRYCANFRVSDDGRVWHRTLLIKNAHPWRWVHPIHEALHSDDPNASAALIHGIEVPSYSDGARNVDKRAKYLRDAKALEAAIRENPDEPRYWFYLGQSYASAGEHMRALDAYRKRYSMPGGWDEERWYALYQQAPLQGILGAHWKWVRDCYLEAFNARPWRAEPLWAAGVISAEHGELGIAEVHLRHAASLPIPQDSFLLDTNVYNWRAADDLAAVYAGMGRADDCLAVLRKLLDSGKCPDEERERIASNLEKAIENLPVAA